MSDEPINVPHVQTPEFETIDPEEWAAHIRALTPGQRLTVKMALKAHLKAEKKADRERKRIAQFLATQGKAG